MRTNGNAKIPAARIRSALMELDGGATLDATSAKFGISRSYLHALWHNRHRRKDAQVGRESGRDKTYKFKYGDY